MDKYKDNVLKIIHNNISNPIDAFFSAPIFIYSEIFFVISGIFLTVVGILNVVSMYYVMDSGALNQSLIIINMISGSLLSLVGISILVQWYHPL
jgi:hypothetical protein